VFIKKHLQTKILSAIFLLIFFTWPKSVIGLDDEELCLKVTEVYPAPINNETEWLELFNCGNQEISLLGWQIFDQLSTASLLIEFDQINLPAQNFLIIKLQTNKLNNTGDGITVYDKSGKLIDQMSFGQTQNDKSWSLDLTNNQFVLGEPNPNLAFQPTPTSAPTPTSTITPATTPTVQPTPVHSPTPTLTNSTAINPDKLQLTEVVACSLEGENEWLELFWDDEKEVEINNWQIIDQQSNVVTLSGKLQPKTYNVFEWSKKILNNSGDHLYIQDQFGKTLFSLALPSCYTGESYSLIDQDFKLSTNVTKGKTNQVLKQSGNTQAYSTGATAQKPYSEVLGATTKDPSPKTQKEDYHFTKLELNYQKPKGVKPNIVQIGLNKTSDLPFYTVIMGGTLSVVGSLFLLDSRSEKKTFGYF